MDLLPCFIQYGQKEMLLSAPRDVLTDASSDASVLCSLFKQEK